MEGRELVFLVFMGNREKLLLTVANEGEMKENKYKIFDLLKRSLILGHWCGTILVLWLNYSISPLHLIIKGPFLCYFSLALLYSHDSRDGSHRDYFFFAKVSRLCQLSSHSRGFLSRL